MLARPKEREGRARPPLDPEACRRVNLTRGRRDRDIFARRSERTPIVVIPFLGEVGALDRQLQPRRRRSVRTTPARRTSVYLGSNDVGSAAVRNCDPLCDMSPRRVRSPAPVRTRYEAPALTDQLGICGTRSPSLNPLLSAEADSVSSLASTWPTPRLRSNPGSGRATSSASKPLMFDPPALRVVRMLALVTGSTD